MIKDAPLDAQVNVERGIIDLEHLDLGLGKTRDRKQGKNFWSQVGKYREDLVLMSPAKKVAGVQIKLEEMIGTQEVGNQVVTDPTIKQDVPADGNKIEEEQSLAAADPAEQI